VDFLSGSGAFGYLCTPAGTSNCVDLGGSTGDSNAMGVISSDMTFGPGTYLVTFLLTGSGRDSTTVTDVSLRSYTFAPITLTSAQTDPVSAYITTTTSGTLTFADADISGNPNIGAVLDGATVSTVTPEPSSLLLLGTGALSMAGFIRRKFRGNV
jgi:hypothetical protein